MVIKEINESTNAGHRGKQRNPRLIQTGLGNKDIFLSSQSCSERMILI
jgi:hypothetical protein